MVCENCKGERWVPAGGDHGFGPNSGVGYPCGDCNADQDPPAKHREPDPIQVDIEAMWKAAGGSYHGPITEHGTIKKEDLDRFLRGVLKTRSQLSNARFYADRLAKEIERATPLIEGLRYDRDHWKANHDNQVTLKAAVLNRPDLGDRAEKVQALLDRALKAEAEVERLKALSVERVMIDIVPGIHGEGEEIYAKSVAEVEELLGKLREELDEKQREEAEDADMLKGIGEERLQGDDL